ncbi:DUF1405 domain-containing protein [Brevibacillus laterosporus]|uniref:DUF1405 domain-containing protein n=1 Tax=Brevibacillus laterosporus TaxID=1465 RepID=UPI0003710C01|nr:DUF1405 domain-containing protein [Brevibacillus laterosporus]ATO51224.1 hypothetical protein BrL25_20255 [Brevibacillus laterosporus DSM 25]MBG9804160.1 membrane protein [Brevibacillus laterosporus]MED2004130.1 DUF1405 domain-containing protein [Brevibacillus laterosporus]MED4763347.1 DUF1405 domain-containing protein [Brevibacillus laterosporus]TPH14814.1 DUF1405 domain-containing protein [Brevibacillus laterosporus]
MKWMWLWFLGSLKKSWFLWTLFFINFLGTIYGFYWYKDQLADVAAYNAPYLLLFVPDSPTGSGLFTLVILMYILGRNVPILEAVASVTNFKYGMWAVGVIVAGWSLGNEVHWQDLMLLASHLGMAVESMLYARYYQITWLGLGIAALWVLNNDFLDYVMEIHPYLPTPLVPYTGIVGLCTVVLSLLSIAIIYYLHTRANKNQV